MSEIPQEMRFAKSHEWVRLEEDGSVTVGISDHAQAALGELVFVETPEVDIELVPGDACAVVESVKAASDVYAPIGGTVVAVNEKLADKPELVNEQPWDDGWIMRLEPTDVAQLDDLMNADDYEELLEDE